jgi:hypothetical protein
MTNVGDFQESLIANVLLSYSFGKAGVHESEFKHELREIGKNMRPTIKEGQGA